jgi:hypothetical protein
MSFWEQRTLPVAKRRYYEVSYRGNSRVSDYLSLGFPFILNAFRFVMSAAHPSAEYLRAYLVYSWLSFNILFFSSPAMNGSWVHIFTAEESQIILHTYDNILFSMLLSGTATNWNLQVNGWSIIE